jgi:hypothetical protein
MAKVVIAAGKTIASPKALATKLLPEGNNKQIKALTEKIKRLNKDIITTKGQDLTSDMGPIRVGKKTTTLKGTKKQVTLTDKSTTNKFNFLSATPQSIGGGGSGGYSSDEATEAAVKSAPIDTVVFIDEAFSSEFIADLLFEDIAGQELLSIARNDTVNGQPVVYQPIKNLGILRDAYNANNLLKLQETSDRFFANFIIKLSEKIPKVGNGENGANYYLDLTTGDGIIEVINIRSDEQVEIQIANAGTIEDVGI